MLKKLLLIVVISGLIIIPGMYVLQKKESLSGFSAEGDSIPTIVLKNLNKEKILVRDDVEDYSLLFILSSSCISCNGNIHIWNRLSLLNNINCYGVSLSELTKHSVFSFKFELLTPDDPVKFNTHLHLRSGVDYTVVIKKGVIEYLQIGVLNINDYLIIKHMTSTQA